jgi:transcriptional regulator with GAF, ATPase, and Fis domain
MMERVANTDATILILGESGTGKELVAKALHYNSRRAAMPFVAVNCAALPEHLLESELFGHRKGAFTGAAFDKEGLFQHADGGTIFLDEVGSMALGLQSKLLRFLQDKELRRVGDTETIKVDVRVIAATNEPLQKRLEEKQFREDLYYRISVIPIELPPLRDRVTDIPLLAQFFLRSLPNAMAWPCRRSTTKSLPFSKPTAGPATSVNCRTPWNEPALFAMGASSAFTICRNAFCRALARNFHRCLS